MGAAALTFTRCRTGGVSNRHSAPPLPLQAARRSALLLRIFV